MAFLPRAELAMWIRQWLLRVIVQSAPPPNPVPDAATAASVDRAIAALVAGPAGTHTGGVTEQRIVDALASTIHREADGWRPRGLGLPVHASNLSSRLGDCDFQIAAAPGLPAPGAIAEADCAGVAVEVEHLTYAELRDRADNAHVVAAFTEHVHAQLNQARTPRSAREQFLAMLA